MGKKYNIYIIPAWYPENEQDLTACFFREQAHALEKFGHRITVLNIKPLSISQLWKNSYYDKRIWQDGNIRTIYHKVIIPIPAILGLLHDWYISCLFHRIIKKQIAQDQKNGLRKPDILHAHVSHSCAYYCLMAMRKLHLPLVVTEHYSGLLLGEATAREYTKVKTTINNASAFIFVGTNFQKAICKKLGITKQTYVIPNMIPSDFTNASNLSLKRENVFTFLVACHLKKHKSVDLVIRAFHEAFSENNNVRLIIAGDGLEKNNLIELTNELNNKRIIFTGKYSRTDSISLFQYANAFVLTSKVEPFGIVYIEAMASGLPCIATKGQGADDIIDRKSGLLIEYGNISVLSSAMKTLYENKETYTAEKIKESCVVRFGENAVCKKISNFYASILSRTK